MQALKFDVSEMTCGGCADSEQRALSKIDGVRRVEVTLRQSAASLKIDPTCVTLKQIEAEITRLGHHAKVRPAEHAQKA